MYCPKRIATFAVALTPPFHPYPCGAVIFCYTCYTLTDIKPLACVALCVARTFLPLLPGGDGADLRGKGMNKSGIKVNLFMFYHAKIFGTQSGQGKILQGIRLPLLIGCRRQGIRFGSHADNLWHAVDTAAIIRSRKVLIRFIMSGCGDDEKQKAAVMTSAFSINCCNAQIRGLLTLYLQTSLSNGQPAVP